MAGLCAAARARELGVSPTVLEKGDRPGGSMLLSSGVVWRYRSLEDFRRECPGGDSRLQRLIVERLSDGLDWLESLGAPLVRAETANPRTVGRRFEPRGLTEALVRAAGGVQTGRSLVPGMKAGRDEPLVLASGGFALRRALESVERGGWTRLRRHPRRRHNSGNGRVLRPVDAGAARKVGAGRARFIRPALRTSRAGVLGGRDR